MILVKIYIVYYIKKYTEYDAKIYLRQCKLCKSEKMPFFTLQKNARGFHFGQKNFKILQFHVFSRLYGCYK